MSCHEAVHKTLLFPKWLNESVGLIHCSMVGINFTRYGHAECIMALSCLYRSYLLVWRWCDSASTSVRFCAISVIGIWQLKRVF